MASEVKYDFMFEISSFDNPGIHVYVASNSLFGGLWGNGLLKMASEVTSGLTIELSDLDYLLPCPTWLHSLKSGTCDT